MLFMDCVYGVPDQETFLRILENAFLPDMRTATTLDSVHNGFVVVTAAVVVVVVVVVVDIAVVADVAAIPAVFIAVAAD